MQAPKGGPSQTAGGRGRGRGGQRAPQLQPSPGATNKTDVRPQKAPIERAVTFAAVELLLWFTACWGLCYWHLLCCDAARSTSCAVYHTFCRHRTLTVRMPASC